MQCRNRHRCAPAFPGKALAGGRTVLRSVEICRSMKHRSVCPYLQRRVMCCLVILHRTGSQTHSSGRVEAEANKTICVLSVNKPPRAPEKVSHALARETDGFSPPKYSSLHPQCDLCVSTGRTRVRMNLFRSQEGWFCFHLSAEIPKGHRQKGGVGRDNILPVCSNKRMTEDTDRRAKSLPASHAQ